ncbi:MAG TPA: nitrilase family protein [Candidatus Hydrogenedentes bacterium]|nr:nitrilase family protein [Candidatus Hydrogenedentota bacterium]HPG69344.1 nitrilase family protein [Candidatus Hydrogenedentota bacterium]
MRDVRVAAVQFEHRNGDKAANLDTIARFVKQASAERVEIVAFPECCITGYWFLRHLRIEDLRALAEPVFDGPSSQYLGNMARAYGITVGAGLVEADRDGRLYNTYVVAMPDGRFARHRKIHCFISEFMTSGTEFTVFDTPHACRVGVLTCYDNNLGENVRVTALLGAEILLAPHQTGGCTTPDPHTMGLVDRVLWDNRARDPEAIEEEFRGPKGRAWLLRWLPTRAHDNGLFLVFSNGVGVDDDEVRTGNAMIIDPYGRILAETWKAADRMVVADLDARLAERNTGRRWIRTRRPELYGLLARPTGIEQDTRAVRFDGQGI